MALNRIWFGRRNKKAEPKPVVKRSPRRNFEKIYPVNHYIVVLVDKNPKRKGTEVRDLFERYSLCRTVQDALDEGISYRMIDSDVQRGYIDVSDSER